MTSRKRKEPTTSLSAAKRRKGFHDVKSEFCVVNASLVLSVPPVFAANPLVGIQEMLDSMVMRCEGAVFFLKRN
jgi:DNA-directed RNA polymerase I subunit RPA43